MLTNLFDWTINLPNSMDLKELSMLITRMLDNQEYQNSIISESLRKYINSNQIKGYTCNDITNSFYYNKFGLIDLAKNEKLKISHCTYTIALHKDSLFKVVDDYSVIGWSEYYKTIETINQKSLLVHTNFPWITELTDYRAKSLKTQINFRIEFDIYLDTNGYQVEIPNQDVCEHDFRLVSYKGFSVWQLVWECVSCGFTCYCSCFKDAIHKKLEFKRGYEDPSHPFYDKACEVCRGIPSSHVYCNPMYARSHFELKYGAYIKKRLYEVSTTENDLFDKELEREASNYVRRELGFKGIGEGFVIETELFRIIKNIFPNDTVIHHYRDSWLGRQELDIYIAEKKIGIEYQGEQHYKAVKAWGDKVGLLRNIERDKIKKLKCISAGVCLVEFTYKEKEKLSVEYVRGKLLRSIAIDNTELGTIT